MKIDVRFIHEGCVTRLGNYITFVEATTDELAFSSRFARRK